MDDIASQVAQLRDQVESLMRDRVTPAVEAFAERAESAASGATSAVRDGAECCSSIVRQQPLLSVLIAAGAGWLLGRIVR